MGSLTSKPRRSKRKTKPFETTKHNSMTQNEIIDAQQAQIDELEAKLETETEQRKSVESELEDLADDCEWLSDILFELEDDLFGEYQSTLALNELDADSIAEHLIETQSDDSESGDETNDRRQLDPPELAYERSSSGPVTSSSVNSRRTRPWHGKSLSGSSRAGEKDWKRATSSPRG